MPKAPNSRSTATRSPTSSARRGGEQKLAEAEALRNVVETAKLVKAYSDAGGNEWWSSHASLYDALDLLDAAHADLYGAECVANSEEIL